MSAKLEQALASKQLFVRKVVSGEVSIQFKDPALKPIVISHNGVLDLFSKRGVTSDAIRESNLKDLVNAQYVEVV
jgi:hypothetical protein